MNRDYSCEKYIASPMPMSKDANAVIEKRSSARFPKYYDTTMSPITTAAKLTRFTAKVV